MADPHITQDFPPHKGTHGMCAPASVAGDSRSMITRPFATLGYMLTHASGVLTPTRAAGSYLTDSSYSVGTAGQGDRGYDVGNSDTLNRGDTSFYQDGFPFRDYEFSLRGLAIVPDGLPFRAASDLDATHGSVSHGGDAKHSTNNGAAIIEPVSTTLSGAVVNAFFAFMSVRLGFKNEPASWELATPLFHPGGLGLDNGPVPTNGVPVGGKALGLPYSVQIPRATAPRASGANVLFRQEQVHQIIASTTLFQVDGGAVLAQTGGAAVDPKYLVQRIKVIYIGERLCAADDGDALIRALANRHGCSVEQARAIAAELKNT